MKKMSLYDFKLYLIDSGIFNRCRGNQIQFLCQCPECGDRNHMSVKIDINDNSMPVLFRCFKCNYHGIMNNKFLSFFNIDTDGIPNMGCNKKIEVHDQVKCEVMKETCNENDNVTSAALYIQRRIGTLPSLEELKRFLYVGRPREYANSYLLNEKEQKTDRYFDTEHRSWFLMSNGNIIGRWHDDNHNERWHKMISTKLEGCGLYIINQGFDSNKPINVYIAEGIMDVIGLYYNYIQNNNVYIAVLGKNYEYGLNHLINTGIFGDSVNVRIFKDPNVSTKEIHIDKYTRELFGKIDIYENVLGYDYGVLPDDLEIHKCY